MKPITQALDKIRIILWNHTVIPFCQLFASCSVTPTHTATVVSALQTGLQKRLVAFWMLMMCITTTKYQTVSDGVAHSKNRSARITWPLTLTLILSTSWMHADLESILWKFGGDPAICLREAICAKVYRQTDRQTTDASPLYKLILGMS